MFALLLIINQILEIMDFTAVYSTKAIKNIEYYFQSDNLGSAIEFCDKKFNVDVDKIIIHHDINDSSKDKTVYLNKN